MNQKYEEKSYFNLKKLVTVLETKVFFPPQTTKSSLTINLNFQQTPPNVITDNVTRYITLSLLTKNRLVNKNQKREF
jgi:hypothetical protein